MKNIILSNGLSDDQVLKNRELFGANIIPEKVKPSHFQVFMTHFLNLFSVILVVCGCMSIVLFAFFPQEFTHLYVGITLILVSFFNAFQEFYQKFKSDELLKGLMKLVPDHAYVRRNGHIQQISASNIVVGDLLILRLGDKIAADSRIIYDSELKVDNSILTGETEPVERNSEALESGSIFEAKNIVFNGTTVASGDGLALVIRTGKDSEIGKLTLLNETSEAAESQLSQEMAVTVRALVTCGLITGSLLMIISFAQGFGIAVSFSLAIGSFLSFLPQGLPSTITTLLTVAAKRMAKKNVLVKNLQGVETLGAITLLATDKTGTLTMNRMDVVEIWESFGTVSAIEEVSNENLANSELIQACIQCNNIKTIEDGRLIGDATEQGIYRLLQKLEISNIRGEERLFEIPFSSSTKWHLVVAKSEDSIEKNMIFIKGAPEKVFDFCMNYIDNNKNVCLIDEKFKKRFEEVYTNLGSRGLRVIACAGRQTRSNESFKGKASFQFNDLTFYGLIGLQDLPKLGVADSIKRMKGAGIRVVMITGDHPLTAEAISRQIGLITAKPENVLILDEYGKVNKKCCFNSAIIHGEMIEKFKDEDWDRLMLADEIIFARTQPKHKLEIVKKFQEYGHVVAVSGDGANDSPALKTADLGISMNKTASDVSKEAADMILLDDNFNTIISGIAEGRLIFENLKKSIRYTLTHITTEITSLASVAILGLAFPFPALLILVFDVFTEMGPAMSFATEPAPVDFLKLKSRKVPRLKRVEEKTITNRDNNLMQKLKNLYQIKIEGESLFDRELFFWAFFQGGIFIAAGSFSAYFLTMILNNVPISSLCHSVNKYFDSSIGVDVQPLALTNGEVIDSMSQSRILKQAQSAFFLSLVLGQWFTLFLTKHRYRYPHGWDIFRNKATYLGMFSSGAIACIVVFVPGFQAVFNTETIIAVSILPPLVSGALLVLYEYPRRYIYFRMKRLMKKTLVPKNIKYYPPLYMASSAVEEHTLEFSDVANKYNTSINLTNPKLSEGLTDDQVQNNRLQFGTNLIPEGKKPSLLRAYLKHLQNLFSIMLILCGLLSLVLFIVYSNEFTHLYVGITLILVSFFNAFLEFYQKYKSEELLKGFMKLVPDNAYVKRNGQIQQVNATDIVVGDLLLLRLGDKIAADARVIYSLDLKVDNSILTGESEPVERDSFVQQTGNVFEARNIVFNGTTVASGEGLAIVIRTGKESEIGKLSLLNESSVAMESQLSQEMTVAVRSLVTAGLATGTTLMIISFSQGFGLAVSFEIAIGSYLAFLPQGLPATITTLLTVAAKRMAKQNVLVKNLQGVETLGAITLLATDKTGTLTMNRMEVVEIWESTGDPKNIEEETNIGSELMQVCKHCSNVKVLEGNRLLGDATEQGIYRLLQKIGNNVNEAEKKFEIPFSSATKWHLVVVENQTSREQMILMKGAPEKVFSFCKNHLNNDKHFVSIDECFKKRFEQVYNELGSRGLRVIACAGRKCKPEENFKDKDSFEFDNLTFYGLIGLQDPPKTGVLESVKKLRSAGIRVVMITGDHPLTAEAISRQIGLISYTSDNVVKIIENIENIPRRNNQFKSVIIHGEMIEKFKDEDWDRLILAEEIIFARTQPKHKLEIVKKFQEYGHVVAVSGDGANDSPALKKADLGISMNKTASDVSKEAADMILLDDNFNTIISGIAEGRLIFENLKKSIRYTLTHITAEISSLATVAICGLAFPIPALLILVFDVFCEIGPAMSFATEPAPMDFLKLKPRKIPRLKRIIEKDVTSQNQRLKKLISDFYHIKIEGESLFDRELLFWAFFQGGIFIAVGAFAAYLLTMIWDNVPLSSLWRSVNKYFDSTIGVEVQPLTLTTGEVIGSEAQTIILNQAQSAFFLSLVLGQWFNLFLTKHRYRYPHGWDIFRNKATYLGMFTSGAIACLVVFVPGLQAAFNTEAIVAVAIAPPIATGILLVLYEYPRRWIYFRMKKLNHLRKK